MVFQIPWWQRTTVYQIYPRSFCDSNGDGIGDLPGIVSRLDYLRDLGVETLWLSPFFKSPQGDFGYDIADYDDVAPEYGTMDDVRRLLDEAHARGLRVVLDMVLNHTSNEHPWFRESRESRTSEKRDWYIWRPGKKPGGAAPPNNWRSLVGPRGWHYDPRTEEWYWTSFLPFQPDLNYRNPAVQAAMLDVVRRWLGMGFDGLRLDIFHALFKDPEFLDNPFSPRPLPSEEDPDGFFQSYRRTLHHPDTLAFARRLRSVVDEFDSPPRFMVGEVFGAPAMLRRYCTGGDGLHMVFLFKAMRTPFTAAGFRSLIAEFEREFPPPLLPTWVFGNHDRPRRGERIGYHPGREKLCAALQLTARGVPFIYYGEEIGMRDSDLPLATAKDPVAHMYRLVPEALASRMRRHGILLNRDACRTPMQWSGEKNAGFTAPGAQPWLPVHPLAESINVAAEERDPGSILQLYRRLLELRAAHPALSSGTLTLHAESAFPKDVLAYRRAHGGRAVDVLLHFADTTRTVTLPVERRVLLSSYPDSGSVRGREVRLRPYEALVVEVD
jgi:oligo-1,6-glucosidase/alpha-glucosidase